MQLWALYYVQTETMIKKEKENAMKRKITINKQKKKDMVH